MKITNKDNFSADYFGPVISTYSRKQAIDDGFLIDVSTMSQEAGFKWPVALTNAAWQDCVAWSDDDDEKQTCQDESGRLWDVLFMAFHAIKAATQAGDRLLFKLYRVPHDGKSMEASLSTLRLIVGSGDQGEPVITILRPNED